jgi:hypothetical protein
MSGADKESKEQKRNDEKRTIFLGAIVAILAAGFLGDLALGSTKGMEYAFFAIFALCAITAYLRIKAAIAKKRKEELDEDLRKVEERRRIEEEKRKRREAQMLDELYGTGKPSEKKENGAEPKDEAIKGERYAKIVAAAFTRLNYDVSYRDATLKDDGAVHLFATRANEICLIHCSKNPNEVKKAEIELFVYDCETFFRRQNFTQDDAKYIFVTRGTISEEALAHIEEERKNNVPIECRVITA